MLPSFFEGMLQARCDITPIRENLPILLVYHYRDDRICLICFVAMCQFSSPGVVAVAVTG